jgi:hypothetical protein
MGWAIKTIIMMVCLSAVLHVGGYQTPLLSYSNIGVSNVTNSTFVNGAMPTNFISLIIGSITGFLTGIYNTLDNTLATFGLGGLVIGLLGIGVGIAAITFNPELLGWSLKAAVILIIGDLFIIPSAALINAGTPILPQPWLMVFVLLINFMWLAACLNLLNGGEA